MEEERGEVTVEETEFALLIDTIVIHSFIVLQSYHYKLISSEQVFFLLEGPVR